MLKYDSTISAIKDKTCIFGTEKFKFVDVLGTYGFISKLHMLFLDISTFIQRVDSS